MEKVLEVKNLSVSFHTYAGEVKAVRDISFDLHKGETLAMVGESGCGKTVTAKALMRLLPAHVAKIKSESKILYAGEDVVQMSKKRLSQYRGSDISMVFQDPMTSLNPTMTIGKQITEAILLHKNISKEQAKDEAIEMLKLVNIPNAENRYKSYPHQLSGGMRQRVIIAIALSCNPKILIADEPTTALDVTIQAQIMDMLNDIKKKLNTSVILVTHDLGVVANFAEKIQVMYAGQIIERGTVREIFYEAKHPYTRALLNSVPKPGGSSKEELYSLRGTPPDLILDLKCCPFHERCQYCMPVCRQQMPDETVLSETHKLNCWLMHPQAPTVETINDRRAK